MLKFPQVSAEMNRHRETRPATHAAVSAACPPTMLHVEHSPKPDFAEEATPVTTSGSRQRSARILPHKPPPHVRMLHVEHVVPNRSQPRKNFPPEDLELLAQSIRKHGLLQPITVREIPEDSDRGVRYEIIAGERRFRATQSLGESTIAARIVEADDLYSATLALIENTQREDLNLVELAQAYNSLVQQHQWTQQQLAEQVSSTRQQVGHVLAVLRLHDEIQAYLAAGDLALGHAKLLVSVEDPDLGAELARQIVQGQLTVRAAQQLIAEETANAANAPATRGQRKKKHDDAPNQDWSEWADRWETSLETKVRIAGKKGNYQLSIRFSDAEDLQRMYSLLQGKSL